MNSQWLVERKKLEKDHHLKWIKQLLSQQTDKAPSVYKKKKRNYDVHVIMIMAGHAFSLEMPPH